MTKAITYSLFVGQSKDCHSLESFIRFLPLTLRAHLMLFEGFTFVLNLDDKLLYSKYHKVFDFLEVNGLIEIVPFTHIALTKSMLYRIHTIYDYDYGFCRDLDSMPTMRERQAVEQFINSGCMAHAINDSVSHTIPMLGGMIGFKSDSLNRVLPEHEYLDLFRKSDIDFSQKGGDQIFINRHIWPIVRKDTFCHRIKGYDCNNDANCTNVIPDMDIKGIDMSLRDSNKLVNHIGQGGYHLEPTYNNEIDKHYPGAIPFWLERCDPKINEIIQEAERLLPEIYYWI